MPNLKTVAEQGFEPAVGTPEEFGAFLRAEYAKWGNLIKSANISNG